MECFMLQKYLTRTKNVERTQDANRRGCCLACGYIIWLWSIQYEYRENNWTATYEEKRRADPTSFTAALQTGTGSPEKSREAGWRPGECLMTSYRLWVGWLVTSNSEDNAWFEHWKYEGELIQVYSVKAMERTVHGHVVWRTFYVFGYAVACPLYVIFWHGLVNIIESHQCDFPASVTSVTQFQQKKQNKKTITTVTTPTPTHIVIGLISSVRLGSDSTVPTLPPLEKLGFEFGLLAYF